jgi:hypothetical protein
MSERSGLGERVLAWLLITSVCGGLLYVFLKWLIAQLSLVPLWVWYVLGGMAGLVALFFILRGAISLAQHGSNTYRVAASGWAEVQGAKAKVKEADAKVLAVEVKKYEVDQSDMAHQREMLQKERDSLRNYEVSLTKLRIEGQRLDFDTQVYIQPDGTLVQLPATQIQMITAMTRQNRALAAGGESPEDDIQSQKALLESMRIPTFTESMHAGLIGPDQKKVLITYEVVRDEDTGLVTGELRPYVDDLENNCTMFLGGASKSGKSTLMAHLGAQEAMMNALFYVIDPHLKHPEKSIAVKLAPLAHAFILPPAMTDAEVFTVLNHAKDEAQARVDGRETRYSGRPIVVIIDEAMALFDRARNKPDDKEYQQLFIGLARFMRSLGTEYNKFGLNGIFASQYVTKDAFKLPGNVNIDFRDACQNQTLLRLPPNQAAAMRLLDRAELRGVRQLKQGHGYMGFYDGGVIRMASGNVSLLDIQMAGQIVQASPDSKKQFALGGTHSVPGRTPLNSGVQVDFAGTGIALEDGPHSAPTVRITGTLQNEVKPLEKQVQIGTAKVQPKEFTSEQELEFVKLYTKHQNVKKCLLAMHLGVGTYNACASRLVERRKLKR